MASLKERKHCYRTLWHRDNLAGQPHEICCMLITPLSKQSDLSDSQSSTFAGGHYVFMCEKLELLEPIILFVG